MTLYVWPCILSDIGKKTEGKKPAIMWVSTLYSSHSIAPLLPLLDGLYTWVDLNTLYVLTCVLDFSRKSYLGSLKALSISRLGGWNLNGSCLSLGLLFSAVKSVSDTAFPKEVWVGSCSEQKSTAILGLWPLCFYIITQWKCHVNIFR